MFTKRIDFALVITATRCNPNGDPTTDNIPRQDYSGYGEISDVCLKHKVRQRLYENGENVLLYSDFLNKQSSMKYRLESDIEIKNLMKNGDTDALIKKACEKWIDVRTFGQVIPLKTKSGTTANVRGPMSLSIARTLEPVDIIPMPITKCLNLEGEGKKESSTLGMKYIIDKGAYVSYGSIKPFDANRIGFSDEDAEKLKLAMAQLLENDASSARPSGSMTCTLYWWDQKLPGAKVSPAIVHRSLNIVPLDTFPYFKCDPLAIDGVSLEILGDTFFL